MAEMEDVINQAISDFNDIESAIEEQGVDVPVGTDTKDYGSIIRNNLQKKQTVDQTYNPESENAQSGKAVAEALDINVAIKYLESPKDNKIYMRDIESGYYVMSGYFVPYPNCKSTVVMDTMYTSVARLNAGSHIMTISPLNFKITCYEILVDDTAADGFTYTRTTMSLLDLHNMANAMVDTVDEGSDNEHYPSAKAVYDFAKKVEAQYSNSLISKVSGEVIRVDDVSPIEHTVKAKVKSKNLFATYTELEAATVCGVTYTYNGDGTVTIDGTCDTTGTEVGAASRGFIAGGIALKKGDTVTISGIESNYEYRYRLFTDTGTTNEHGGLQGDYYKPTTIKLLEDCVIESGHIQVINGKTVDNIIVKPQLEIGDTATEYEPYVDPSTVTVTRCGKNLFNKDEYSVSVGNLITNEVDGHKYTVEGDVGTATLAYSAGAITFRLPDNIKINDSVAISLYVTLLEQGAYDNRLRVWGMSENDDNEYGTVTLTQGTRQKISCTYSSGVGALTGIMFYLNNNKLLIEADTLQVELNEAASDFEAYNGATYTPEADGTVNGITSLSPTMTLLTDTAGVTIEAEYNQDSNSVKEGISADIAELDRVQAELIADMGDIDTALDSIIAIQESLIGGE